MEQEQKDKFHKIKLKLIQDNNYNYGWVNSGIIADRLVSYHNKEWFNMLDQWLSGGQPEYKIKNASLQDIIKIEECQDVQGMLIMLAGIEDNERLSNLIFTRPKR